MGNKAYGSPNSESEKIVRESLETFSFHLWLHIFLSNVYFAIGCQLSQLTIWSATATV